MSQLIDRRGFIPDPFGGVDDTASENPSNIVVLPVDIAPEHAFARIGDAALVVIQFATSADDRGLSRAAALRDLGFQGRLRARGHVLVDQFRAVLRSGFDELEISDAQALRNPEAQWRSVTHAREYRQRLFGAVRAVP